MIRLRHWTARYSFAVVAVLLGYMLRQALAGMGRAGAAPLHYVLPRRDGGGVVGRFRAGSAGNRLSGRDRGLLGSAAGRTMVPFQSLGHCGLGVFRLHGAVHERDRAISITAIGTRQQPTTANRRCARDRCDGS